MVASMILLFLITGVVYCAFKSDCILKKHSLPPTMGLLRKDVDKMLNDNAEVKYALKKIRMTSRIWSILMLILFVLAVILKLP